MNELMKDPRTRALLVSTKYYSIWSVVRSGFPLFLFHFAQNLLAQNICFLTFWLLLFSRETCVGARMLISIMHIDQIIDIDWLAYFDLGLGNLFKRFSLSVLIAFA